MSIFHVHDGRQVHEEPAPQVVHLTVTRVTFRRGEGCCEKSPVRMVTAYYDDMDEFLFEIDPAGKADKS